MIEYETAVSQLKELMKERGNNISPKKTREIFSLIKELEEHIPSEKSSETDIIEFETAASSIQQVIAEAIKT